MTNKKMWAIIVALIVVVAIIAVATGVFSKPPEEAEISPPDAPTDVVASETETEHTTAEDDANIGSLPGSGTGGGNLVPDPGKIPQEEKERIETQHQAEQAKTQEQTQETTTPPEETQPTTPPAQEPTTPPQSSDPSGTAGTAMHNGSTVRAFNSVSDLNGLKPIKPFETVMVNGVPYGWTGSEWGDASANEVVGGGGLYIEGGGLSGHQVGD